MDYQALLAALLVVLILAVAFLTFCYTTLRPENSKTNWSGQLAKWLRVVGMVFAISFGVLWLCHKSIGALETRYFARISLYFNTYFVQTALLLEATRVHCNSDTRVYLCVGMGLLSILLIDTTSIVLVICAHPPHIQTIPARWLPPSFATCAQLSITALLLCRPNLDKVPATTYFRLATISVCTNIPSIIPLWISVVIQQEIELAVLGCQVSYLVSLNWPQAFSPPILVQIYMGPEEGRKDFCCRVDWPWKKSAVAQQDDDEVELTGYPSRATSLASTARNTLLEVVSSKTVYPWSQVALSPSAKAPFQSDFLQASYQQHGKLYRPSHAR